MAAQTKAKPRAVWTTAAMLILTSTHGRRLLSVMVMPVHGSTDWQVIAVETTKPDPKAERQPAIDEALVEFDDGHKNVGGANGVREGIELAEKYTREWQAERERVEPLVEG